MEITMAKSAGFCFGVKRAIKIAMEAAAGGGVVEMLGDIVHNEVVVASIRDAGIRKVSQLTGGPDKTLLIRAHGSPQRTFAQARQLGYTIIDATCPMVKEIYSIAVDFERQGCRVVIVGDRDHEEVRGIAGQLANAPIIIESAGEAGSVPIDDPTCLGIVVQSTQSEANVQSVVDVLRHRTPNIRFKNTICKATADRQREISTLPLTHDVMIVIGSQKSANTKRLYEIACKLNPNTHRVLDAGELQPEWFAGTRSVAVTAGASTPDESIAGVVARLRSLDQGT